ncbi:MAG: hypothetical protein RPU15_11010, partial [Candidatus Sedimenticola sp. (ex Thyasira tokunagai)]
TRGDGRRQKKEAFKIIEDLNDEFGVSPLCLLLDVSRGGYYAWKKRPGSFQSVYNGMIIDNK